MSMVITPQLKNSSENFEIAIFFSTTTMVYFNGLQLNYAFRARLLSSAPRIAFS